MANKIKAPTFSSRMAFILVTIGSAVGLGNIWSFPFNAGMNGGSGFLLVYLVALLLVATPMFIAELLLGRMGRASPPTALVRLQQAEGHRLPWKPVGYLGLVAGILVLSFYSVIAGQAMAYGVFSVTGLFEGASAADIADVGTAYQASPGIMASWMLFFIAVTGFIMSFDIREGMESTGKYLMPLLFLMLLAMVAYALETGDSARAFDFLFGFHPEKLSFKVLWQAVGQAFFTLGIGVGGILMLGAYMGENVNMPRAVGWIVLADLLVALLAGLAIFPLVFAHGLDPAVGPGLIFDTLPNIFAHIRGGWLVGGGFFLLLTFAALTSAISLMAPSIAWFEEKGIKRALSALGISFLCALLGLLTVFSFNIWSDVHPLAFIDGLASHTVFDLIREGINIYILPLGGLTFALMAGWGVGRDKFKAALNGGDAWFHRLLLWLLRYVAPLAIIAFFLTQIS